MLASKMTTPVYWDSVLEEVQNQASLNSWRKHMRDIYQRCVAMWLSAETGGRSLKTDLFEEAVCDFGVLQSLGPRAVGLDYSTAVARAGRTRMKAPVLACDLRSLPFVSNSFSRILSGSSLDHFERGEEIDTALRELARVMEPGGVLVITLDNPSNPAVWVRNHLPLSLLKWCGLVPYHVGPTYSAAEAKRKLEEAGLQVTDSAAVLHVPRAPAIWIVQLLHRLKKPNALIRFEKHMMSWERLQQRGTAFWTGYYVALRAVKPRNAS